MSEDVSVLAATAENPWRRERVGQDSSSTNMNSAAATRNSVFPRGARRAVKSETGEVEIGVVKGRAHRVFFVALKIRGERVEMVAPLAAQQVLDMASSIRRLQSREYNEGHGYFEAWSRRETAYDVD